MNYSYFHNTDIPFALKAVDDITSGVLPAILVSPIKPETFRLKNGMSVIVLSDHRAPVVTHMVWYKVGSVDEKKGKTGLAHFLEHLMFKGTDSIENGEFAKEVARNGGNLNAFTSYDFTAYYERISKDKLPLVMRMEADRMRHLRLDEHEVLSERNVVLEERLMRVENNPVALLVSDMREKLFGPTPYGGEVIGTYADIAHLTRQDALDFYKKYYAPSDSVLIVAGDVDISAFKVLAQDIYGAVALTSTDSRGFQERNIAAPVFPKKNIQIDRDDSRAKNIQIIQMFPELGAKILGPKRAAIMEVMSSILGGVTGRLYTRLVMDEKIAAATDVSFDCMRGASSLVIQLVVADGYTSEDLIASYQKVLDDFLKNGPTNDELKREKILLTSQAVYDADSQMAMAQTYGALYTTGFSVDDIYRWPSFVDSVTQKDVWDAARAILTRSSVTGILRPALHPAHLAHAEKEKKVQPSNGKT